MRKKIQIAYIQEHFIQVGYIDGIKWFSKKTKQEVNIHNELVKQFGEALL